MKASKQEIIENSFNFVKIISEKPKEEKLNSLWLDKQNCNFFVGTKLVDRDSTKDTEG